MLVSLGVLLAIGWWLARSRRQESDPGLPAPARSPFHAVTIAAGPSACERARALARRNCALLPVQAPRLPLVGCDQDQCRCRYVHHADRRRRVRRAIDRGWPSRGLGDVDRRNRPDRRRDDE
ncbi:MAG: hypothetical protein IT483_11790 [Gammaproteobacteria bacterium]|nr:hypothetical protein [Gammaproteobacteria bacterium]